MNRSAPGNAKRSAARNDPPGGQLVAWAGFGFGTVVSVIANVLAARIPPAGSQPGWTPSAVAQFGAAVWPIALVLSVEALARVKWPGGIGWIFARYVGVVLVAAGSAVISYGHIHSVLGAWGYDWRGSAVGPLVIDGLMVVCGFALLAHHRPAGDRAGEDVVTSLDPELVNQVRKMLAADPKTGRRTVKKELGISEHYARQLVDYVRSSAPATLPPASDVP